MDDDTAGRPVDTIGIIEIELMKLVRHLETFARRTDLYAHVDRAGYLALRTLDDLGAMSVNALSDALHLDASTVTRQAAALEAGGFVERHRDPDDRRSSSIVLTAAGRDVMRSVEQERRRSLEALVTGWSEGERESLGVMVSKLNASLVTHVALPRAEATRSQPRPRPRQGPGH